MESKRVKHDNFHMVLRSHCKKRETSITIHPEEIIFNILVWLPAEVLYNVMRYVCRQWYRIIESPQFVSTHLMLSTTTLLMYCPERSVYQLLDVRECHHAKLTGFEFPLPSDDKMVSTCNGLILIYRKSRQAYYVGNPITGRMLALPPLSSVTNASYCGLAFEASSKVYKVVVAHWTGKSSNPYDLDAGCAILTVGIDKAWRVVNCAHLKKQDITFLWITLPITSTEFIYWVLNSENYILGLDLKSERIKRISLPYAYETTHHFLPKGNSISILYQNSDYSMEVWLLKDFINEEWVKVLNVEGGPIRNELDKHMSCDQYTRIIPTSWLGNNERILFRATRSTITRFIVYDLKTHGCCEFALENDDESWSSRLVPFINSLAWVC